jgi:hypothetical protein
MSRYARALAGGTVVALGVWLLATAGVGAYGDDEKKQIAAAQKDVVDLAKDIEAGNNGEAKAAAVQKKYDELNTVMQIYKPRAKGGLGIGPPSKGDGIELKIINMGKRAMSPATLRKESGELIKMAYINIAMSKITKYYPPPKKPGKDVKEWKQYADEMAKGSKELIEAVKSDDPKKVKAAANNINGACNNCHSDFRDSN